MNKITRVTENDIRNMRGIMNKVTRVTENDIRNMVRTGINSGYGKLYDAEIREMDEESDNDEVFINNYLYNTVRDIKDLDKDYMVSVSKPIKLKKPFKVKFKEFINKLISTFQNNDNIG